MGNKIGFCLLNKKGQSTVEYVLLMAVVLTFMTTVWNSKAFEDFFGKDSKFFVAFANSVRVNYRFAANVPLDTDIGDSVSGRHPSFTSGSTTRFFTHGKDEGYPLQ
jgi:hypothetical protein